jgi:hypothetical protein
MRLAIVLALAAACGGCASITRGHTNQVQITSQPSGAEARTSMGHACTTPCTLQFNRKDEFVVTISKPGFHTEEIPVVTRVAGAGVAGIAGNVILGGVVGMAVDASSGATLEHFPNPVIAQLEPVRKGQQPRVIRRAPPPPPAPPPEAADQLPPQPAS